MNKIIFTVNNNVSKSRGVSRFCDELVMLEVVQRSGINSIN